MAGSDRQHCEWAHIGVDNSVVDTRGSQTNTVAPEGATDFATDLFVGSDRIRKDNSDATHRVQGHPGCSLANDKFVGGVENELIEKNTLKQVDSAGGREVASLVVEDGELKIEAQDSTTLVENRGAGQDSITAGRIVKGNAKVSVKERNKHTVVNVSA